MSARAKEKEQPYNLNKKADVEKALAKVSSTEAVINLTQTKLPANVNLAELIAKLHVKEVMDELVNLAKNAENEETRRKASNDILNRAYGMPAQSVQVSGGMGAPLPEEVREATNLLLKAQYYIDNHIDVKNWPQDVKDYFNVVEEE